MTADSFDDKFVDPRWLAISIIKKIGVPWWYMDFDDLVSEGCIGYLVALKSYKPDKGAGFTHWAYIKVHGYILSYLLHKSPKNHLDIDGLQETHIAPSYDESILDKVDIQNAMKVLSKRSQDILRLYYWDRLSLREIAKYLNMSSSGVNRIRLEALSAVKKRLI